MSPLRALSCAALVLALSAANLAAADSPTKKGSTPTRTQPDALSVVQKLGSLPLRFEPNQGQTDSRVKYLAHGPGFTLFLTPGAAVLSLPRPVAKQKRERDRLDAEDDDGPPRFETSVVRMRLVGANPDPLITAASPQPGTTNYFLGNDRKKWRTGVPGYDRVGYHAVYPGIDLVFYGNPQRLEYDFAAEPGADVSKIQLAFEGADKIEKVAGDLLVHVGDQTVTVHKPLVYQADKSKPIDAQFVLRADNRVGFALGAYDHSQPLIIDPALTYSSYLGGSVFDNPLGIALDSHGDIVIAGTTQSPDFPVTGGPPLPQLNGSQDIFLTVLDPLGRHLLYSSYIGGSGNDSLGRSGLRLDSFDNVYLAGSTGSLDFPQVNPLLGYGGGSNDGFILIASSSSLLFSSYIGGAGSDSVQSLSLDAAGDIILAGNTNSADFPTLNPLMGYNTVVGIYKWAAADPWFAINNGLLVRNINAVAVDPSNHATLYASTASGGIYKSTDAGANWSAANNGLTNFIVRHIEGLLAAAGSSDPSPDSR